MLVCPHILRYKCPSAHPDAVGAEENRRKFGGKELLTELGLNEYDQEARRHIPARCAFSQPDPLAGKYPWLSPFAFCAADPINLTDPTGLIIDTSHLSEDDLELYKAALARLSENEVLATLFNALNESDRVFVIEISDDVEVNGISKGGVTQLNGDGSITLSLKRVYANDGVAQLSSQELIEEHFHGYQNDNKDDYASREANFEMEAKTFVKMAYSMGQKYDSLAKLNDLMDASDVVQDFINNIGNAAQTDFIKEYYRNIPEFVNFYRNVPNVESSYLKSGLVPPASILKLYKKTFLK